MADAKTIDHDVVIVGGGLAGLTAAYRLEQAGIDFLLLEARDRFGGRIMSAGIDGTPAGDGFDLGPSWVWPQWQPALGRLLTEMGLSPFAQYAAGDMIYENAVSQGPVRHHGFRQDPPSMRIPGGTGALIDALKRKLPEHRLRTRSQVLKLAVAGDRAELVIRDESGDRTISARQVVIAVPPRLAETSMVFEPPLPTATAALWRDTATWMAPHAKFFAVYDRAFWREAGLSGNAQSRVGPLVEIHDATTASGKAALFGFVGVPADRRAAAGDAVVIEAALAQLVRLFGAEAGAPRATLYKDWAADPLTATTQDQLGGDHPAATRQPWISGPWAARLLLAGSETSQSEPGYLAGAVEAAEVAASTIIRSLGATPETQESEATP